MQEINQIDKMHFILQNSNDLMALHLFDDFILI